MKIFVCLFLFFPLLTYGQHKINFISIGFASECCGPPDGKAIFDYIDAFKKKNKIDNLDGYLFAPLGPEGECSFLIELKKLSDKTKIELVENIENIIKNNNTAWRGLVSLSTHQKFNLSRMKKFSRGNYKKQLF